MRVTVYAGSSPGTDPAYAREAARLGQNLAEAHVGIVYGGAHVGLMGALADAALVAGGEVIGVMPRFLVDREIAHRDLTRLDVVDTMHERKARMAALGDAAIAFPGGIGTLEEFFETWTWHVLGLSQIPVALYDIDGFWTSLHRLIEHMVNHGFVSLEVYENLVTVTDPAGVLAELEAAAPTAPS